jgi:hypothetical protein
MSIATDSAKRGVEQPYDANTTLRRLDLTTADGTITLATGVYDLTHDGTGLVFVRPGADSTALTAQTSGAAELTGHVIPAGAVATIALDATDAHAGVLHACTASGTATLRIIRKVLA